MVLLKISIPILLNVKLWSYVGILSIVDVEECDTHSVICLNKFLAILSYVAYTYVTDVVYKLRKFKVKIMFWC